MGLNETVRFVGQSTAADFPGGIDKLASNRQPSQRGREYPNHDERKYFHHIAYFSL
jgi:hypothetical protein